MKLTFILMITFIIETRATSFAQNVNLNVHNVTLREVFVLLKKQSGYEFLYNSYILKEAKRVTVNENGVTIKEALDKCFADQPVSYIIDGNTIIVTDRKKTSVNTSLSDNVLEVADITITGVVKDEKGNVIPGVTVKVKGGTMAAVTNLNGSYTIKVPGTADVLLFSFIGYETQEVTVGNAKTINIVLKEKQSGLDEVVVVAFGAQRKATLTGSIATVTTEDLLQSPVANISNSLAGRLPGLFTSQATGEPGSDQTTLRIRGVGTFTGNTAPLVMVDGIETPSYNNIDPNEIESLSILKDASATAVYGVRGANGVLLITTKRGKKGPPRVSYTFNEAVSTFTELPKEMDAYNYAIDYNQAQANDAYVSGSVYNPRFSANDIQLYKNGTDPIFHPNLNWWNIMLKKVTTQMQHNLTVSGGTDNVKYFISGGYFYQPGLLNDFTNIAGFNTNLIYSRYNFRSNFDFKVNKRLTITVDLASQNETRSGNNQNTSTLFDNIGRANPIDGDYPMNGEIINNLSTASNPLANLVQAGYRNQYTSFLNGTIKINHKLDFITPGLNFRADANYQNTNSIQYTTSYTLVQYTATQLPDGTVNYVPSNDPAPYGFSSTQAKTRKQVLEYGFDYDRLFGDNSITALLLYREQKLFDPTLAFDVPNGHQGVVGRVTYNYKSKYLAEYSAGYEGTENFAPGKRFGYFPSYSIGWVPTLESFFPKNKVINFIKLRATYGIVGNDNIGGARFLYNPTSYTYSGANSNALKTGYYFGQTGSSYQVYQDVVAGTVGNPNLTWERAVKVNFGADIYMFNNNLTLTVDVFHEQRSNILEVPGTPSLITGFLPPAQNLGIMTNKGLEAALSYKNNIGEFNYFVSGNFSFARNKIVFESEVPQTYSYRNQTGQRFGQYYGLVANGFYNTWAEVNDPNRPVYYSNFKVQPGDIKFKDINGDGVINDNDMVPIGYSNIPEISYGLSLRGSYKGFDLSVLFQGTANVSLAYTRREYEGFFDTPSAGAVAILSQSWTPARYASGQPINFPRFTAVNGTNNVDEEPNSMFIANAAYLRIKNVELGYTFKSAFLQKIKVKSARLFVNADNLLTWDSLLPGIDPENLPQGTNFFSYPLTRTINMGLNVGF